MVTKNGSRIENKQEIKKQEKTKKMVIEQKQEKKKGQSPMPPDRGALSWTDLL